MKKRKWIFSTLLFTKVLGRKLKNEGILIGSYAVTCVKAVGNSFLKFNAASMGKIDGRSGSILELRKKDKNAILQQPFGWILISFQNLWILVLPTSREKETKTSWQDSEKCRLKFSRSWVKRIYSLLWTTLTRVLCQSTVHRVSLWTIKPRGKLHVWFLFADLIYQFIRSNIFEETSGFDLHLKLENMQNTNSFKIRGVANQFCAHQVGTKIVPFVTMSAGRCVMYSITKLFLLFHKM